MVTTNAGLVSAEQAADELVYICLYQRVVAEAKKPLAQSRPISQEELSNQCIAWPEASVNMAISEPSVAQQVVNRQHQQRTALMRRKHIDHGTAYHERHSDVSTHT